MKMSRARFNHMRHERENDGLPQVLAVNNQIGGANTLNTLRKTTYTRTELMQRTTNATGVNRPKRLSNIGTGNRPTGNGPTVGPDANANRRMGGPRGHFLPRVARLNNNNNNSNIINNNNNNNNKCLVSRSKSPIKKKGKANNSVETRLDKSTLPAGQQQLVEQLENQLVEQLEQQAKVESPHLLVRKVDGPGLGVALGSSRSSSSILSSSSTELHEIELSETLYLPDKKNQSFVYLCEPEKHVKELVMARSLRNSIESVDQQLHLAVGASETKELDSDPVDIDPLSKDKSPRGQMEQPKQPKQPKQERQQNLELEHQLLDVRERQKQLQLLADQDQDEQTVGNEAQTEAGGSPKHPDMVKQIKPSLQREIQMLQQLGAKLEATLNVTKNTDGAAYDLLSSESSTQFYTPRSTVELYQSKQLRLLEVGCRRVEHRSYLRQFARVNYYVRKFGCVREYRIETKTLTELKTSDELQSFYMPLAEGGGMQCTSFRKLRENPNVLLQQLRPLSPDRPFNLLEHDAMFFNSLVGYGELQMASSGVEQLAPARESGGATTIQLLSAGNTAMDQMPLSLMPYSRLSVRSTTLKANGWSHEHMERLLLNGMNVQGLSNVEELRTIKGEPSILSNTSLEQPDDDPISSVNLKSTRFTQRRPVSPLKTPEIFMEPRLQTQLLKTVLVGIVQVAVFLVLVMAFTYPDARC